MQDSRQAAPTRGQPRMGHTTAKQHEEVQAILRSEQHRCFPRASMRSGGEQSTCRGRRGFPKGGERSNSGSEQSKSLCTVVVPKAPPTQPLPCADICRCTACTKMYVLHTLVCAQREGESGSAAKALTCTKFLTPWAFAALASMAATSTFTYSQRDRRRGIARARRGEQGQR